LVGAALWSAGAPVGVAYRSTVALPSSQRQMLGEAVVADAPAASDANARPITIRLVPFFRLLRCVVMARPYAPAAAASVTRITLVV
jgi:hypothetical protein